MRQEIYQALGNAERERERERERVCGKDSMFWGGREGGELNKFVISAEESRVESYLLPDNNKPKVIKFQGPYSQSN